MEEIKVGEYVRTEYDGIGKILEVRYMPLRYVYDVVGNIAFSDDITKHSPNIIDLIECGDYVNGHLVIAVDRERLEVSIENCAYGSDYEDINGNIDIKTIVTKEQFEAIKYEVD